MRNQQLPLKCVVFDLEWTAWEDSKQRQWSGPVEYREIYDIGAALITGSTFQIEDTFHRHVKLTVTKQLPKYSTKLTGIRQEELDEKGIPFAQALAEFNKFTQGYDLFNWGIGDLVAIEETCRLNHSANPFSGRIYDIRRIFSAHHVPVEDYMSSTIVEYFGVKNERTAHQGLDDALNIVEALRLLKKT